MSPSQVVFIELSTHFQRNLDKEKRVKMLREEMCKIHPSGTQFSAQDYTVTPLSLNPESIKFTWSGGTAELCLQVVFRGKNSAVVLEKCNSTRKWNYFTLVLSQFVLTTVKFWPRIRTLVYEMQNACLDTFNASRLLFENFRLMDAAAL